MYEYQGSIPCYIIYVELKKLFLFFRTYHKVQVCTRTVSLGSTQRTLRHTQYPKERVTIIQFISVSYNGWCQTHLQWLVIKKAGGIHGLVEMNLVFTLIPSAAKCVYYQIVGCWCFCFQRLLKRLRLSTRVKVISHHHNDNSNGWYKFSVM